MGERDHHQLIGAELLDQPGAPRGGGQLARGQLRPQDAHRVGLERDDGRADAPLAGGLHRPSDHALVPQVDAVEAPQRNDARRRIDDH